MITVHFRTKEQQVVERHIQLLKGCSRPKLLVLLFYPCQGPNRAVVIPIRDAVRLAQQVTQLSGEVNAQMLLGCRNLSLSSWRPTLPLCHKLLDELFPGRCVVRRHSGLASKKRTRS